MKTRMLSVLVAFSMLFTFNIVSAADFQSDSKSSITLNGINLSVDDFNKTLTGPPSNRTSLSSARSLNDVSMKLSNVSIIKNEISFEATVLNNGKETGMNAGGTLHAGYKSQRGANSVVGDIKDTTKNFEILLFEIFNDDQKDNLLVASTSEAKAAVTSGANLKIYLLDSNKELYIFEDTLPKVFSHLDAGDFTKGDSRKDMYWFLDIANTGEKLELQSDQQLLSQMGISDAQIMGLDQYTMWTNPTTFYHSIYIGGEHYQSYSLPYVEYKYVNVKSQDSRWIASFKVAEHQRVGNYTYYGNNVFVYRNLQISFASGNRSVFVKTEQQGRMYKYSGLTGIKKVGDQITAQLLKKALSSLPGASTYTTVLGYINTMSSSTGTVTLGSAGVSLQNSDTFAVGEKLSDYQFEESTNHSGANNNGDYFTYHAILNYIQNSNGSQNQIGALKVSFDMFNWDNYSSTPISKDFQLNYTSTQ
ncbi:hypothetical protein D3P07_15530 [Paenibacillus sp. 1011MAR3C5]|uniref:hypothetical protein n=1 Tax=Paenibacillus sp. 1011MAR3C5 TaxID=1675787 RepID=UPI000E6CAFE6|nr:hypothetical protein [Paenibacillus sp. 1011MAR3C5]RJE87715.1 hypothetical protein D3P07_15530 [Paenibacillus sp. 1011MAR3C5]